MVMDLCRQSGKLEAILCLPITNTTLDTHIKQLFNIALSTSTTEVTALLLQFPLPLPLPRGARSSLPESFPAQQAINHG